MQPYTCVSPVVFVVEAVTTLPFVGAAGGAPQVLAEQVGAAVQLPSVPQVAVVEPTAV